MGTSRAACAVSGVPIESAALAFLVCRSSGGRWQPFGPATPVALDEYQHFVEYEAAPLELLSLWYPDSERLWDELRSLRVEGPLKGPGGLELGLALVEPSIATAVERLAKGRLPKREELVVALAFPRQGVQQAQEAAIDGVRLLAAINLLGLALTPFESTVDAVPGEFGFEDVAPCFEEARKRLAAFPALCAAIDDLRQYWAGEASGDLEEDEASDEDESDDEELESSYGVTRSFLGVYTITVPRALASGFANALTSGATTWEDLEFHAPESPEHPSASLRPRGAGYLFFLTPEARAALTRALTAGTSWTSLEGEVVVQVC